MYLITKPRNNEIIMWGNALDHLDNGYPRLTEENVAFSPDMVKINEVNEIPEGVIATKYCYTPESGFYLNPEWIEPNANNVYNISDEVYAAIIDDYTMGLLESGVL